jgi:hypothetical protein
MTLEHNIDTNGKKKFRWLRDPSGEVISDWFYSLADALEWIRGKE